MEILELDVLFLGERTAVENGAEVEALGNFVKVVPAFEMLAEGGPLRQVKITGLSGGGNNRDLYREFVIPNAKKIVSDSPVLSLFEIWGQN